MKQIGVKNNLFTNSNIEVGTAFFIININAKYQQINKFKISQIQHSEYCYIYVFHKNE